MIRESQVFICHCWDFFLMSIMQMFNPSVSVSAHTFGSITRKETEYKGFCVTFFMRISVPFDSHDFCFKKSFMEWLSQCGWSMNIQNPFQKWHFAEPLRNTIMNFEWLFLTTCHRANFDEAFDPTKKHVPRWSVILQSLRYVFDTSYMHMFH